jgi:ankyrin repeat protein
MWAIADRIPVEKLNGKDQTSISRGDLFRIDDPETLLSLRLENEVLTGIATAIQQSGLGSLKEAYMCIVPPLSVFEKLPIEAVFAFTRQQTRDHEVMGRWSMVVSVFTKLYQQCTSSRAMHPVMPRVMAVLIYLFLTAANELKIRKDQMRDDGISELQRAKDDVLRVLKEARSSHDLDELIRNFANLYRIQQRLDAELWKDLDLNLEAADQAFDLETSSEMHKLFGHPAVFSTIMQISSRNIENISVRERDCCEWTPLHYATVRANKNVVENLLKKGGADPKATDLAGWAPLHYAIETLNGEKLKSITETLIQNGAEIEMHGLDGMRPLHCAAKRVGGEATSLLIQAGATVDAQDNSRKTPLHWAAYSGNEKAIEDLLQNGANSGARDDNRRIALHLAAVAGRHAAVEVLLKGEMRERESVDRDRRTPLHLAAMHGSVKVVKLLIGETQRHEDDGKEAYLQ